METSLTRSGKGLDLFIRNDETLLQSETEAALMSLMRDVRILPSPVKWRHSLH